MYNLIFADVYIFIIIYFNYIQTKHYFKITKHYITVCITLILLMYRLMCYHYFAY